MFFLNSKKLLIKTPYKESAFCQFDSINSKEIKIENNKNNISIRVKSNRGNPY